jgi:hypothetical protein
MERELWPVLYPLLRDVGHDFSQRRARYHPWVIAAVFLWAALHDRPIAWACQARHWTTALRPLGLPSAATMSRRLRSLAVGLLLRALEDRLRRAAPAADAACLDGKPLVVGGCSKDPDAKRGRAAGGFARGYKLHAIRDGRPVPAAWAVAPLNTHETIVAEGLLEHLPAGRGALLADGNYDSSKLFDRAAARGYQLLVPPPVNAGRGHHYVSPHRRRSIATMGTAEGRAVYAGRSRIERDFGNATGFGGGLGPLPGWVRRTHRVTRWVRAKLLINGARILRKQGLAA